jgi:hypothetical protein
VASATNARNPRRRTASGTALAPPPWRWSPACGLVDAREGGHLGEAPGVGVGAVAVLAQLRHAEAVVHARVAASRRPARGHHRGGVGEADEAERKRQRQRGD